MKPRVVIDARMVGPTGHGIGQYVTDLAEGLLAERSNLPYEPAFLISPETPHGTPWKELKTFTVQAPFLDPREWIEIPKLLASEGAALYHSPSFASLPLCPCPWVITIHDLNHLTYGGLGKKLYYQTLLKNFALKAQQVVTVSEFSQGEIAEWLGMDKRRIEVVPNAFEREPLPAQPEQELALLSRFQLQRGKYFFNLSSWKEHKNLPFLLRTFKQFKLKHYQSRREEEFLSWPLVLPVDPKPEFKHDHGILFTRALGAGEAQILLKNAGAFVFPSLYEGFGRPPIEAAVAGVPVLVSDIPPHREVLRGVPEDEVLFLPPKNILAWVHAFEKVTQGQVKTVSAPALEAILARYSKKILVHHMDQIYQRVLGL